MKTRPIGRPFARISLLVLFIELTACATQAVAKDKNMVPHHIPLRFHDLIGQLAAEMPTSLDRIQTILGFAVSLESDDGRWLSYEPKNLVTIDGVRFQSIMLLVRKPAPGRVSGLTRIIVSFDLDTCIPMAKVRQEFGMTEYFPWPSSHRLAETYYNPDFSYRFMVTDSRIRANFETEGAECVGEININNLDPTKL